MAGEKIGRALRRGAGAALYRQIKDLFVSEIEAGALGPHEHLPSERELVEELGVSRITVRQALRELVQEGYLYSAPGKGFFVAERPRPFELNALLSFTAFAERRGLTPGSSVVDSGVEPASPALGRQLDVPAGTDLMFLARVRLLEGTPVAFQRLWIPRPLCPRLLDGDLGRLSVFDELRKGCGVILARAETTVGARPGTEEERTLLDLGEPGVVLAVDQLTFDAGDAPVELSLSVHHPQRYPISLVQGEGSASLIRPGFGSVPPQNPGDEQRGEG